MHSWACPRVKYEGEEGEEVYMCSYYTGAIYVVHTLTVCGAFVEQTLINILGNDERLRGT